MKKKDFKYICLYLKYRVLPFSVKKKINYYYNFLILF